MRAGERDALLLAAGELEGIAVAELRQLDHGEHLGDARADLLGRALGDLQAEGDVLGDGQIGEERVGLEHHADVALVGAEHGDVAAVDPDLAGARRFEAGDHAQRRRLAAAARPEERDELAAGDGEVEVANDRTLAP